MNAQAITRHDWAVAVVSLMSAPQPAHVLYCDIAMREDGCDIASHQSRHTMAG